MSEELLAAVVKAIEASAQRQTDEIRRMVDVLRLDIRNLEWRARRSLDFAAEAASAADSAAFLHQHMQGARPMPHRLVTLDHALEQVKDLDGMALEFGVYRGESLRKIVAARPDKQVYGFDSFEGLPEFWLPDHQPGRFGPDDPAGVKGAPDVPGAEFVVGWFDQTLPGFMETRPGPVAFLHVDSDLYSSARTVLEHVGPRLVPGSVVVFDEYFNYPNWRDHEFRAWTEYVERTGTRFSYLAYTADAVSVSIRIEG